MTFYSAELKRATEFKGRRVKICNRETGNWFMRDFPERFPGFPISNQLAFTVRAIYTSPCLRLTILWWDEKLQMLFFETKEVLTDGNSNSSTETAV